MMHLQKAGLMILIISSLMVGCEEEELLSEIEIPLNGIYTLAEMTVNVEATSLSDTIASFMIAHDGINDIQISAGTLVLEESTYYSNQAPDSIGGTVTLNNDGSARLAGNLPLNIGSGCSPLIFISELASDGAWLADTTSGTFTIDLVVDALDIDGTYTLDGDQLEVRYEAVNGDDERLITHIDYLGNETAIIPVCLPVSTTTERIMILTLD